MKKILNIFVFTLITFFTVLISVNAKEVKLKNLNEILSSDVNSAYIIGNYLFTSKHKLTLEDIMLASRSIEVTDKNGATDDEPIYNEMSIVGVRKSYENDDDMVGTWVYDNNLSGTTKINNETLLNIRYVDYDFIAEDTKILKENVISSNFSQNYKTEFDKLNFENNDDTLKFVYDEATQTLNVSGIAKINNEVGSKYGDESLKYFLGLVIEVPNATDDTKATLKSWQRKTETNINFDVIDSGKRGFALVLALSPDADSKEAIINIDLDGPNKKEYKSTIVKINWKQVKFQSDSELSNELSIDSNINENEALEIKNVYNYEKTDEDTYKLSYDKNSKTYTLSGNVVYQEGPISHFDENDPKGYYVLIKISDEKFMPNKTIITVPCKSCTTTDGKKNLTVAEDGYVLLLMALDNETESKTYEITVDFDGNESLYLPTTYSLKYDTGLTFSNRTSFTMSVDDSGVNADYGYDGDSSSIELIDGALSGIVKLTKDVTNTSLGNGDKLTNYYVPIKLTIVGIDNNSGATVKVNEQPVTDKNTILLPLSENNKLTEKFTIEVDRDGDATEYVPSMKELTYKDLGFQSESSKNVIGFSADVSSKENFNSDWDKSLQEGVTAIDNKDGTISLNGPVKVQKINAGKKAYVAFSITVTKSSGKTPQIDLKPTEDGENNGKLIEAKDNELMGMPILTKTFLYELPSDIKTKTATLTLDLDGDEDNYAAETYTVKFEDLNIINLYTISFADVEGYGNYSDINVYADEIPSVKNPVTNNDYLVFDKWVKSESEETVDLTQTLKEDVTVKPYFKINLNDYMENYKKNLRTSGIVLEGNEGTYNFKITAPEKELNSLNDIKLTETLTNILKDLKVTSIDINDNPISDYTEVSTKISELIKGNNTYDGLVVNDVTFTITVTDSEAYKISDDIKEYTFNFISDFRVVKDKEELNKALNSNIKTIYIAKSVSEIDLGSEGLEINVDGVTIEGKDKTIKSINNYVINVSNNATIKNLKIDGESQAQKGILVSNGSLTADTLTVNNINHDSYGVAPAIEVSDNASATVSNLTYDSETYDNPAVRAKDSSTVTLNRSKYNKATSKNYEEVTTYEDLKKTSQDATYGDKKAVKKDYNYKHYYLDSNNETKWYELTFEGDFNVTRVLYKFYRYVEKDKLDWNTYTETILPNGENAINYLTKYDNSKGYAYEVNNVCAPTSDSSKCVSLEKLSELPQPTGDTIYSVKLKYVGLQEGVVEVHDVETLREKVKEQSVKKIILDGSTEYDLKNEPLTITHPLTINGTLTGDNLAITSVIKGEIIVSADNVSLIQLAVEGNNDGKDESKNIITVNNTGFYIYQSSISAAEGSKFKNAIYYYVDSPKTTIYFTKFNDEKNNITTFIEFAQNLGAEKDGFMTELLGNTFSGGTNMTSFVKIDTLDNSSESVDIIFRQSHFKFQNKDAYAVEISNTPTGDQPINFYFASPSLFGSTLQQIRIRIDVTDTSNDASKITFHKPSTFDNLEIHYFKEGADQGINNPYVPDKEAKIENTD